MEARAGGAWVGEAPGGCQWSDACRVLARRSRGYARPAEGSFFGCQAGNPHGCAFPNAVLAVLAERGFPELCLASLRVAAVSLGGVRVAQRGGGGFSGCMLGREGLLVK